MDSPLLRLIRQTRSTKATPSIFKVNAGPDEEGEIAAGEVSGQIGPNTIIIRKFGHLTLEQLEALPLASVEARQ
jgi:hypothetical protein